MLNGAKVVAVPFSKAPPTFRTVNCRSTVVPTVTVPKDRFVTEAAMIAYVRGGVAVDSYAPISHAKPCGLDTPFLSMDGTRPGRLTAKSLHAASSKVSR